MIRNSKYLIISLATTIIGLSLSFFYRPYVYSNNINDFGFADVIGSFVSVIAACTFFWAFKNYSKKEKNKQIIIIVMTFGLFWELFGLLNIHGTFDIKDSIACVLSGGITFLLR